MSRRGNRGSDDAFNLIFGILFFGVIAIVWVFKGLIKGIAYICTATSNAKAKSNMKKKSAEIINNTNGTSKIGISQNITKEEIREKLNLIDKDSYNSLFEEDAIVEGLNLFIGCKTIVK